MADSEAVRSLRKRLHAGGDHTQCRPERCAAAAAGRFANGDVTDDLPAGGPILPTVVEHLANLGFADDDPRLVSCKCAVLLAREIDKHHGPGVRLLVRDLLFILEQVTAFPGDPPHAINGIQARIHRKKTEMVLRHVQSLADVN